MRRLLVVTALVLGLVAPTAQACEDTAPPIAPQVRGVPVVSGTQALVEWSDSTYLDQGPAECRANGVTSGVNVYQNGEFVAANEPFIDSHGIRNYADHTGLVRAWLSPGNSYTVRAWAMDAVGNAKEGDAVPFTTPSHLRVVVAGQVKQAASSTGVVQGLTVSATKVIGSGAEATATYSRGIYRLPLPAHASNEDWDLTFGPACVWWCVSNTYGPVTDRITVGSVQYPPGRILLRSKTL